MIVKVRTQAERDSALDCFSGYIGMQTQATNWDQIEVFIDFKEVSK